MLDGLRLATSVTISQNHLLLLNLHPHYIWPNVMMILIEMNESLNEQHATGSINRLC